MVFETDDCPRDIPATLMVMVHGVRGCPRDLPTALVVTRFPSYLHVTSPSVQLPSRGSVPPSNVAASLLARCGRCAGVYAGLFILLSPEVHSRSMLLAPGSQHGGLSDELTSGRGNLP